MASMDLKTGSKLERGQGQARPAVCQCRWGGNGEEHVRLSDAGPWTVISLSSLVCASGRGRAEEGGREGRPLRDYSGIADGSHACRADMSAGTPTSSPTAVLCTVVTKQPHQSTAAAQGVQGFLFFGNARKSTKTLQDEARYSLSSIGILLRNVAGPLVPCEDSR